ncbi:MAG: phosphatidylglycerol lysyltransferase domain-containing protein [Gemmatimonadota bacterium]|nr:phosphatidylglycerol lysyltransferase domain-containing protein [Gemmatimonadota bacterium]
MGGIDLVGDAGVRLHPLVPQDAPRFKRAVVRQQKRLWCYQFPFVYCYGSSNARAVRWAELDNALSVFVVRERVDLLFPPLPLSRAALRTSLEIADGCNGDRSARILWSDEQDAGQLASWGLALQPKGREYLFDPLLIARLEGRGYRDLRKTLHRVEKARHCVMREFRTTDVADCLALLRAWKKKRRGARLLDMAYTKKALRDYPLLDRADLRGWAIVCDGRVVAFCLGGEITGDTAGFFAVKSDLSLPGLGTYARWHFFRQMARYGAVNDGGDLGLPGLAQAKQKFRPVEMLEAYAATRPDRRSQTEQS